MVEQLSHAVNIVPDALDVLPGPLQLWKILNLGKLLSESTQLVPDSAQRGVHSAQEVRLAQLPECVLTGEGHRVLCAGSSQGERVQVLVEDLRKEEIEECMTEPPQTHTYTEKPAFAAFET